MGSPWFGIESSDNLNLIQPVNPWTGREWQIYNEYFQWKPTHNENSASHKVYPGDVIYGSVTLDAAAHAYRVFHEDRTKGHEWSVNSTIAIQKEGSEYKSYTMTYFVFEKVCTPWMSRRCPLRGTADLRNIRERNMRTRITWRLPL